MLSNIFLLLLGFFALIQGANLLVTGAGNIARSLRIPNIIIGLTIVALGTSAPEAFISVNSSVNGNNGVLLGNIIGSNVFNLLVVLGVTGMLKPYKKASSDAKKDYWFSILSSFILLFLLSDIFLFKKSVNVLTRIDGIILIMMLVVYFWLIIRKTMSMNKISMEKESRELLISDILFFIAGLVMLLIGGEWVVDNASKVAEALKVSEGVIGLTIVAMGTSLPELITGVVAIKKSEEEIAIGNVVGSNILNILFILGISSLINPINVPIYMYRELVTMTIIFFVVYYLIFQKKNFRKIDGIIMLLIYIIYTIILYV